MFMYKTAAKSHSTKTTIINVRIAGRLCSIRMAHPLGLLASRLTCCNVRAIYGTCTSKASLLFAVHTRDLLIEQLEPRTSSAYNERQDIRTGENIVYRMRTT